jgi:hypothetical protein
MNLLGNGDDLGRDGVYVAVDLCAINHDRARFC